MHFQSWLLKHLRKKFSDFVPFQEKRDKRIRIKNAYHGIDIYLVEKHFCTLNFL